MSPWAGRKKEGGIPKGINGVTIIQYIESQVVVCAYCTLCPAQTRIGLGLLWPLVGRSNWVRRKVGSCGAGVVVGGFALRAPNGLSEEERGKW